MATPEAEVGVVGLGVMGSQLVLNLAEKLRCTVSGFDLDSAKGDATVKLAKEQGGLSVSTFTELTGFVASLKRPRKLILLVPAGKPVESAIDSLQPQLEGGDIIMDCGNEWFELTESRQQRFESTGILYMGCGLSGGSQGARHGPCLMPGGPRQAWEQMQPLLEGIAAKAGGGFSGAKRKANGESAESEYPCVRYIGPGGAGHYVKMVHNGIEYGDMQLIAEAAHVCREVCGLSAAEVSRLLSTLNDGPLGSFLMEITAAVHLKDDPQRPGTGAPLMDAVMDSAGSKGTGKWTIQQAADLGVPCSTHAAALEARYLSSLKAQRGEAAALFSPPETPADALPAGWRDDLEDALLASKLCSYAQGMAHLRAMSDAKGWQLRLSELGAIWQGGCIIRAKVLRQVQAAYSKDPELSNLLLDSEVAAEMTRRSAGWRRFVVMAMQHGIPVPALAASLCYFDTFRSSLLRSAQCIQAQRDCFGGHGFKRLDQSGTHSVEWRE